MPASRSSSGPSGSSSTTASASRRRSEPGPRRADGSSWRPIRPTRRSASSGSSAPGRTTGRRGRSWPARTASCCRRSWSPSRSGCRSARRGSSSCSIRRSSTRCSRLARDRRPGEPLLVTLGRVRDEAPATTPRRRRRACRRRSSAGPARYHDLDGLRASDRGCPRPAGRAASRRRATDPRHGPCHQGPRVRPRRRRRDGGRPLPERAGGQRRPRTRSRAYEEERRLAYVAWTRARRSLTLLYDPAVPSPFLLEAFDPDELGLSPAPA